MSADLKALLKDRNKYADQLEIQIGDAKMSLGDLRAYDEAMDGQLTQQLQAERQKLADQQKEIDRAREEVVQTYLKMNQQGTQQVATQNQPQPGTDWQNDPFFQPIARHLETAVVKRIDELANQYKQMQQAIAMGVKYIGDQNAKTKFGLIRNSAPEDWRKDLKFEELYKMASEQKLLDEGGFPDVEKAFEKWSQPKREQAMRDQIRAEIRAEEEANRAQSMMSRPGSGFGVKPPAENQPRNFNDAFNQAKSDPAVQAEWMKLIGGNLQ